MLMSIKNMHMIYISCPLGREFLVLEVASRCFKVKVLNYDCKNCVVVQPSFFFGFYGFFLQQEGQEAHERSTQR